MRNIALDILDLDFYSGPITQSEMREAGYETQHVICTSTLITPLTRESFYDKGKLIQVWEKMLLGLYDQNRKFNPSVSITSDGLCTLSYPLTSYNDLHKVKPDENGSDPFRALLAISEDGFVSGCIVDNGVQHYQLRTMVDKTGYTTEAFIAGVASWIIAQCNTHSLLDDVEQFFQFHFMELINVYPTAPKEKKIAILRTLAHNLYQIMENGNDVQNAYGITFPWTMIPACKEVEFADYVENNIPIKEILVGDEVKEFPFNSGKITSNSSETVSSISGLIGKYEVNPDRKLFPYEEQLLFNIPSYYQIPKDLIDMAELYKGSFDKLLPFKFFMLYGPSGTGKSEWAKMFSSLIHRPYVTFNCDNEMTKDDLLTRFIPDNGKPGSIVHVPTTLLEAIQFGWVVEIAEPTLLRPSVLPALNSLFDATKETVAPDGRTIKLHPETVVIMTTNSDYEGCNRMNQSIMSRFVMKHVPQLERDDLIRRMKDISGLRNNDALNKIADVFFDALQEADNMEIHDGAIDPRGVYQWATAVAINGKLWEDGTTFFLSKCSMDDDNMDIFVHCMEKHIDFNETIKV